jgi:glycosyl transferase family 87
LALQFMESKNLRLALFGFSGFLILFHVLLFWTVRDKVLTGYGDFASFYAAGWLAKTGEGRAIYSEEAQTRIQALLFPRVTIRQSPLLYAHPAFEVLLFLFLAYLPYPVAYSVWTLLSLFLLLLVPRILEPSLAELKTLYQPLPYLVFFAFFPVFIALLQGQDSILLLFLFTLVYVSLKRGEELRSGMLLGLALFKFQVVVPFLAPFLLRRRWRVLAGFAGVSVVLVAASAWVTGLDGLGGYVKLLLGFEWKMTPGNVQAATGVLSSPMPNLRGALYALMGNRLPEIIIKITVVAASLGLLWCAARQSRLSRGEPSPRFDLGFSLNLAVALLVSYYLFLHDLSPMALPIALVANHLASGSDGKRVLRVMLISLLCVFFLTPAYLLLMGHDRLHWVFWPLLLFCLGVSSALVALKAESQSQEAMSKSD